MELIIAITFEADSPVRPKTSILKVSFPRQETVSKYNTLDRTTGRNGIHQLLKPLNIFWSNLSWMAFDDKLKLCIFSNSPCWVKPVARLPAGWNSKRHASRRSREEVKPRNQVSTPFGDETSHPGSRSIFRRFLCPRNKTTLFRILKIILTGGRLSRNF